MGRIFIFKEDPPTDDSWIVGVIISLALIAASIKIWPIIYESYMSTENVEEQKLTLLYVGIVLVSCICTTLIYIFSKKWGIIKFSEAFFVICIFTTIAAGAIYAIIISQHEAVTCGDFLIILIGTLLCSGVPSFVASCICVLYEKIR